MLSSALIAPTSAAEPAQTEDSSLLLSDSRPSLATARGLSGPELMLAVLLVGLTLLLVSGGRQVWRTRRAGRSDAATAAVPGSTLLPPPTGPLRSRHEQLIDREYLGQILENEYGNPTSPPVEPPPAAQQGFNQQS